MSNFQYSLAPFSFAGGATIDMLQLGAASFDPGSNNSEIVPSGLLTRSAVILDYADPSFRIETADIDKFFATASPTVGYSCTSGGTFRAQQRANNGTFTGGSSNYKIASSAGYVIPESITVSQDKPAVLSLRYFPFSTDGLAEPVTISGSNALGVTPGFNSQFYLGPLYINSSLVEAILSVKINFGIGFRCFRSSGNVFCVKGHITSQLPTFEFGFSRPDIASLTSPFLNAAAGTVAMYLQRGVANGTRVAANGTTHFKISAASGALKQGSVSGQGLADVDTSFSFLPTAAIATSLASDIP